MQWIKQCLVVASVTLGCTGVFAQSDELDSGFRRMNPAEEAQLRTQMAAPVPAGLNDAQLMEFFRNQDQAADRLGDAKARETILRQWMQALPDDFRSRSRLATLMRNQRQYDQALALRREAINKTPSPSLKALFLTGIAVDLFEAGRRRDAQTALDQARSAIDAASSGRLKLQDRINLGRAGSTLYYTQSLLHDRFGRWDAAVQAATSAQAEARKTLNLALSMPDGETATRERFFSGGELANTMGRRIHALRANRQWGDAEEALKAYIRLSQEIELRPASLSGIYRAASSLRFAQREFVQAESYARKAALVLEKLDFPPESPSRTKLDLALIIALQGQKRWPEALAQFERLDGLVKTKPALQRPLQLPYERAMTYLHTNKPAQAATLFEDHHKGTAPVYGDTHFFTAQSRGLQGVALWRAGVSASKVQALNLLKTAVHDYMLAANADYMENVGYRKEVRELIFATYLEALATTPGEDATQALGPADWVRGGVVQEALNDAAVRSAATAPALAEWVRQEQDAKNELMGLRSYLAGETGNTVSPLPEIAAQIRARMAELEANRITLQAKLKAQFPDYEQLVRPAPLQTADVAKALGPDDALVMLLPTEEAVYVWAITTDRAPAFTRVALPQKPLQDMVKALRHTLDFAEMGNRLLPFNIRVAADLYQRLLQPVQSATDGKKQWIIAAGGALSQIPFGVLLTEPLAKVGAGKAPTVLAVDAPWLIKKAAITQVPSISAWMAVKRFAKARSATELMLGWGDPLFGAPVALAAASPSPQSPSTPASSTRHVILSRSASVVDLEKQDPTSAIQYADLPALPETRDELLAIAATLQANPQQDLRLGAQASKSSVIQSNSNGELIKKKVLVFATHGLMAGDLPNLQQPALALAATPTSAQDPLSALLTLQDVLSLKLNADWVVLSACNTAAADGKAEEALSGLARGFFYAGSRSLLVTHWSVESESAKELTTATFAHYTQNPQAPKAESLRQAMLQVMAQPAHAHPAYWAPYALVGDGGR